MRPGPYMSHAASRQRAAKAYELRTNYYSWREIRDELGYQSVGAVQAAVKAHVKRNALANPTETNYAVREDAWRLRCRALGNRFAEAYNAGEDTKLVLLARELARADTELAKLQGLYAPEKTEVNVTVSATQELRERMLAIAQRADRDRAMLPVVDAEVLE